jgi:uncharacterized phage protein (TIGR02218 family)
MKTLSQTMQSHLDSGTTTLCECWRLTLRSGEVMGFTDHDEPMTFDGTTFEAQAGFSGSEIHSSTGLSVDNLEASGALKSGKLEEARLKSGDFDHAKIEIWRVNWQDPSQRILQRKGNLGEVSYGQGHFTAEVRGLAHFLNQPKGRLFQYSCDANLGDARCGALIANIPATIINVGESSFELSGLDSYTDDWFTRGLLLWTAGPNAGRSLAIKRQRAVGTTARIDLWHAPKFLIATGETVFLNAGCDKIFSTCTQKFGNAVNFRGMPHMPGRDFVLKVASAGDAKNTGGRLGV